MALILQLQSNDFIFLEPVTCMKSGNYLSDVAFWLFCQLAKNELWKKKNSVSDSNIISYNERA